MEKIWIYQSSRPFSPSEEEGLRQRLEQFAKDWTSHNQALHARGELRHGRFVVLGVDESQAGASGCSIDKSVRFLQNLGFEYGTDFFNRLQFAYLQGGEVKTAHKDDFARLYAQGEINDDTTVFNNLVKTRAEMEQGWQVPLGESWHKRFV